MNAIQLSEQSITRVINSITRERLSKTPYITEHDIKAFFSSIANKSQATTPLEVLDKSLLLRLNQDHIAAHEMLIGLCQPAVSPELLDSNIEIILEHEGAAALKACTSFNMIENFVRQLKSVGSKGSSKIKHDYLPKALQDCINQLSGTEGCVHPLFSVDEVIEKPHNPLLILLAINEAYKRHFSNKEDSYDKAKKMLTTYLTGLNIPYRNIINAERHTLHLNPTPTGSEDPTTVLRKNYKKQVKQQSKQI